jgi:hypothetical protein
MNMNRKQVKRISQALLGLIGLFLFCGCSSTPARPSGSWRMVGVYNENHSIMTADFLDEQYVATDGVLEQAVF